MNNRSQIVRYNKCASTSKDVISGIPQGTVIGPNSFIAFVNDVPDTHPQYICLRMIPRCTTEYVTLMITDNSNWILTSWTHGLRIGV